MIGTRKFPDDLKETWFSLIDSLKHAKTIEIKRPYTTATVKDPVVEYELHGFSDASEKAYGASIYLHSKTKSGAITVSLVVAKSKSIAV